MHGFVYLNSIFDCRFSCLNQTYLCLIFLLLFGVLLQIIQLSNGNSSFFDSFFPYFKVLVFYFLFPFALFFFLLHSENLHSNVELLLRRRVWQKDFSIYCSLFSNQFYSSDFETSWLPHWSCLISCIRYDFSMTFLPRYLFLS